MIQSYALMILSYIPCPCRHWREKEYDAADSRSPSDEELGDPGMSILEKLRKGNPNDPLHQNLFRKPDAPLVAQKQPFYSTPGGGSIRRMALRTGNNTEIFTKDLGWEQNPELALLDGGSSSSEEVLDNPPFPEMTLEEIAEHRERIHPLLPNMTIEQIAELRKSIELHEAVDITMDELLTLSVQVLNSFQVQQLDSFLKSNVPSTDQDSFKKRDIILQLEIQDCGEKLKLTEAGHII